ncbi:MAG: hypothetical protein RL677_450 [Actinomycetota bacterium]
MLQVKIASALATFGFLVSACTPPLPPEVLAAYAEAEIYCGEDPITVKVNENILFAVSEALYLYGSECGEESVLVDSELENPDIILTDLSATDVPVCESPQISLPVFSQAYGLAYNLEDIQGIALDSRTVLAIYSGEITMWDAPQIADLNPGIQLPSTEIKVKHISEPPQGVEDFFAWMERLSNTSGYFIGEQVAQSEDFFDLSQEILFEVGAISLLPIPLAFDNVLSAIEIVNEDGNVIYNDSTAFGAGATQVSWVEEDSSIKVTHDPLKDIPLDPGSEEIVAPYQGLGWSYLYVCGDGNLNLSTSAVARFLLRQDAQGTLDLYGITPLYEPLRLEAAELAGRLLPQPEIPEDL